MANDLILPMDPLPAADKPLCSFVSTALPKAEFLVLDWQGEEALSRPYRFEVRVASRDPALDDEVMLGRRASLYITDAQGLAQPYHGVVTDVEQLDSQGEYFFFRLVLEPRMVLLRQFQFSDIWLDSSLQTIITDILREVDMIKAGLGQFTSEANDYDFDLRVPTSDSAFITASFTCQFEETSFAFFSRLLEHYGVYYYFEHGVSQETLVMCGDRGFQPLTATQITYRHVGSNPHVETTLAVANTFRRRLVSQANQVVLQDFSATNAQLKLQAVASVADASTPLSNGQNPVDVVTKPSAFLGDYGLYGQHFGSTQEGAWLAKRRAQMLGCRRCEFHGSGRATGLRAGYPMVLVDHPRKPLNVQYQVIEVQHAGSQPLPSLQYSDSDQRAQSSTSFVALPADVQYRAPCSSPKPNIKGVLSAIVDGDESGKPLLNEHGCYKVNFPFIRTQKPATRGSAWLRMATLSAGAEHGMHFPLLKGAEVLVSFLDGDPDRPIITGAVPNSENLNRVNEKNVTQSGLSSPGGHFVVMDDQDTGAQITMGSPFGASKLIMGAAANGIQLTTNVDMELDSDAYSHYVGGVYRSRIGQSSDFGMKGVVDEHKKVRKDSFVGFAGSPTFSIDVVLSSWKGGEHLQLARQIGVNTFSAEFNAVEHQCTVSVGGESSKREDYTDRDSVLNYNKRGVKADVNEGNGYCYNYYKKDQSAAQTIKATSYSVDAVIATIDTSQLGITSDIGKLRGINALTIVGNDHTITLNSKGIVIKTTGGAPIVLDGNVIVGGSLLVKETLQVEDKLCARTSIVTELLVSTEVSADSVKAISGSLATVLTTEPVALQLEQFTAEHKLVFSDKRSSLKKALNMAAQINNIALSLENALLQYKVGNVTSPVKLSAGMQDRLYAAQELAKKVLHAGQLSMDVLNLYKSRVARALPDNTQAGPLINEIESGFSETIPGMAAASLVALAAVASTAQSVLTAARDVVDGTGAHSSSTPSGSADGKSGNAFKGGSHEPS
ncbi:Rhs element Vgr protein [Pseudomonas sp. CFII64]|uniref:type VI secretion system Vgr family protein n=1 Tax=Pseudomonas sp. CFII64 TaxID=911242 RepID=UPI000356FB9A|nr:type VI secretion system Vgr family protein [Pseudomonas sp. CFII64]EPJ84409.1 Rhs element Vgr protein [Pseudomonas sp. CFII64]